MIISHKYKYIFIEVPRTACTAIANELCLNYDGQRILHKHTLYPEFFRMANAEEKTYFVFAGVRNPLEIVVGDYFKIKNNHKGNYTNPKSWRKNGGWLNERDLEKFNWIKNTNADFPSFFLKYYKLPVDNLISLNENRFDYIIRFENLQDDFSQALELIGITKKRSLPSINKTTGKENKTLSYYTPEIQSRAIAICGPFMKKWGYDLPFEWGDNSITYINQLQFDILSIVRKVYWRYFRRTMGYGLPQFLQGTSSRNF